MNIHDAAERESEAEIVRHMTHEEWRGCRIESYRWKVKIPEALQGSEWDWSYASHWSTPAAHEEAEALVSVKDAERALLSALSSERERAERAEADAKDLDFQIEELTAGAQAAEAKVKEVGEIIVGLLGIVRDGLAIQPDDETFAGQIVAAALRWIKGEGK